MTAPLPPDLSRLGDHLDRATARRARALRRRALLRRFGGTAAAAALALSVFAPGVLQPSDGGRPLELAAAVVSYEPVACDRPRGATFTVARPCAPPGVTDVAPSLLARRYAVH